MYQLQTDNIKKKYPLFFKVANYFRNKRYSIFRDLFQVNNNSKILDVGGTFEFWNAITDMKNITILNITKSESNERITSVVYAGGIFPFADKYFDVVFSNSVIEHVGDFYDQINFANEVQRCGNGYFVQVPSYWFPYEPHAQIPFYQFMPAPMKIVLRKIIKRSEYPIEELLSIRLLTKSEIRILFPKANIITERFFGLPKSYYIIGALDV